MKLGGVENPSVCKTQLILQRIQLREEGDVQTGSGSERSGTSIAHEIEQSADPKPGAPRSHLCITLVKPVVEDLLLILQLFALYYKVNNEGETKNKESQIGY